MAVMCDSILAVILYTTLTISSLRSLELSNQLCDDFLEIHENLKIETISNNDYCSWAVESVNTSIISLGLTLDSNNYSLMDAELLENCFNLTTSEYLDQSVSLCFKGNNHYYSVRKNNILVSLKPTNPYLRLNFTSTIVKCPFHELKCFDNKNNITTGNHHSFTDKLPAINFINPILCEGDFLCPVDDCFITKFNNESFQCDGILDCYGAEDELNCTETCPSQIQCPNEQKCIDVPQICDEIIHCSNGFDEENCMKLKNCQTINYGKCSAIQNAVLPTTEKITESKNEKDFNTNISKLITLPLVILLIISLSCVMLFLIVTKCMGRGAITRRLLENPPEMPLPPFQGPGETESSSSDMPYSDTDFKPGGEVYEKFVKSLDKIKANRMKNTANITYIKPKEKHEKPPEPMNKPDDDKENCLKALASIKLTTDMCIGLGNFDGPKNEELLNIIENHSDTIYADPNHWRVELLNIIGLETEHKKQRYQMTSENSAKKNSSKSFPILQ